ncbi:PspA/IM30 family protein [Endozoicomonas sp. SM1973]|uniref:PspA/IM30 family protein n=1 Tax=Spartinivicinus marinus TaxID=2994442 RepID=A0A853I1Z7_9GAMM|nr:PspA/IM30 family protein [Spartinivicinus marinus]MCX4027663.1 PspA/IM30 family protein [Spartinivicinus marinus]NYZ66639.1 PspA/IM30 family protein [Spartinivicinus marinus]
MGILNKLMTAIRGAATETGEAIVDSQALRILDQEIRDASEELNRSKTALANIMAKQKLVADKCAQLTAKINEYEQYAGQALDKGDETLAVSIADKIAELEAQLASEEEVKAGYTKSVESLRSAVKHAESNLKRLRQQVDTVKATDSVQKAQAAVAARYSGANSKMTTAADSLERIKQKQAERAAQMEAAHELSTECVENDLESKMKAAGIKANASSANDVLARLKAKK